MVTDDQVMQSQRHGVVPLAVRYANSYVRRLFAEKDLGGLYHLIGVVEKERSLPEEFWLFCRLYEWAPARSGIWQHYEGLPEQRFQQILGALERLGLPEIAENHRLGKAAWDGPDRAAALDAWLDSRAQEIHDLAFGCGTKQDVPLPQTTPFDSNPKARAAHLDSYSTSYRACLAGQDSMPACTFGRGGIVATAGEHGGWAGRLAAVQVELETEPHRKESRR